MRAPFKLDPPPIYDDHYAATQVPECEQCDDGVVLDTEGVRWLCPWCKPGTEAA